MSSSFLKFSEIFLVYFKKTSWYILSEPVITDALAVVFSFKFFFGDHLTESEFTEFKKTGMPQFFYRATLTNTPTDKPNWYFRILVSLLNRASPYELLNFREISGLQAVIRLKWSTNFSLLRRGLWGYVSGTG